MYVQPRVRLKSDSDCLAHLRGRIHTYVLRLVSHPSILLYNYGRFACFHRAADPPFELIGSTVGEMIACCHEALVCPLRCDRLLMLFPMP